MSGSKRKFVIDTDAGIDDAHAILMALGYHHKVDVIALTTTHGNVSCQQVALNVLRLLNVIDRMDVPVYKGVDKSLTGNNIDATYYHGMDGFGDVPDPEAPGKDCIQSEHAVQALIRLANEHKGNVELICLGPLTNIAVALRLDPEFGKKLKHCYLMGGNYEGRGNVTHSAEFNFYCDPESANVVLNELSCEITVACWELCLNSRFDWNWYHNIFLSPQTNRAKFLKLIEKKAIDNFYSGNKVDLDYGTADQVIMAIALKEDICIDSKKAFAVVECQGAHTRGQLSVDWHLKRGSPENVTIVTKIKFESFEKLLVSITKEMCLCCEH